MRLTQNNKIPMYFNFVAILDEILVQTVYVQVSEESHGICGGYK